MLTVKGDDGFPGETLHLLVARNVLDPGELKFFASNVPAETSVDILLLVAFSRWRVERCFEDQKSEIGLDQYECRRYLGLKRHLILSAVSYLFLAWVRQEERGGKPGTDGLAVAHGRGGDDSFLGLVITPSRGKAAGESGEENRIAPAPQRSDSQEPHKTDSKEIMCAGHQAFRTETLDSTYRCRTKRVIRDK